MAIAYLKMDCEHSGFIQSFSLVRIHTYITDGIVVSYIVTLTYMGYRCILFLEKPES